MDSANNKSIHILPTNSVEGKLEEKMIVAQLEVMDTIEITPDLPSDTQTFKATVSNLDQTVSVKKKVRKKMLIS